MHPIAALIRLMNTKGESWSANLLSANPSEISFPQRRRRFPE